uniref:Uncharacterized protein n=1 Tax=Arundo donax TaxID=35708 RepID=A0A0A9H898_ARUDO
MHLTRQLQVHTFVFSDAAQNTARTASQEVQHDELLRPDSIICTGAIVQTPGHISVLHSFSRFGPRLKNMSLSLI